MKLNDQQIQELFAFTEKKRVVQYDLQVELVDHLAESIEEELSRDANLTFEAALQKVYKQFGIFGFAKVVQQKSDALYKTNERIWRKAFRSFFNIPKVTLTLCIFAAAWFIGGFVDPELRALIVCAFWILLKIVEVVAVKKWKKRMTKKLMLTELLQPSNASTLFMFTMVFLNDIQVKYSIIFAIWITAAFLIEFAVMEVHRYVHRQARQLYPEAFAAI